MDTLKVLRARPALFFRLSGIRLENFDDLVKRTHPQWLKKEHKRLSRKGRKRAIGAGRKYELDFPTQLLMCLIYCAFRRKAATVSDPKRPPIPI